MNAIWPVRAALARSRAIQKRDVFAHSYIESFSDSVNFVSRTTGGTYKATKHEFTQSSFEKHILEMVKVSMQFYDALGASRYDLQTFAEAALRLNRKSKTSTGKPSTSKS